MTTVALVGNPNCGKTTLFNALTGSRQRVGNWSGVTVERKSGFLTVGPQQYEIVDLPGVYSLAVVSASAAVDESIACEFILSQKADVVVNILDASNLERHLYLTMQLIEMRVPLIVVVNMIDVARSRGLHVQLDLLSKKLGCPVIALQANKGSGLTELKNTLQALIKNPNTPDLVMPYVQPLPAIIDSLAATISSSTIPAAWLAARLLEDDIFAQKHVSAEVQAQVAPYQQKIRETAGEDADILLADARYRFIHELVSTCVNVVAGKTATWTARIDKLVLNRILGIPIFLGVMYCLFLFAINIGGALQDFFDIASNTIFVDGFSHMLTQLGAPNMLVVLLANGIGKGLNTTMTFIPVIGAMFLFLALLEDSGYMARAAFVVDRLMRAFGLPGKAFVPMIVGFGCNVPAVMASRTLENKRDRILTIMMSPFMSCGARLAIYAVFTAAFFPVNGHNVVFALYLIGIIMAVLTGFVLRKTLLFGQPAPLVMELPPYHLPHIGTLLLHAWQRLKTFIFRAGKLIVPVCVLIGVLHTLNLNGTLNAGEGDTQSILSAVGRFVTPLFAPMGIHQDNWPATVGLVTGILAKEVVVGTLNTLYSQVGHLTAISPDTFHFWQGMREAFMSISTNFSQLAYTAAHPLFATAPLHTLNQDVYGVMYQHFDGQVGAFSYLLFVLLYFPCVSTTAAMLRELDYRWAVFSIFWMTGVAYGTSVIFYQAATIGQHALSSSLWVAGIFCVFALVILGIRLAMTEGGSDTGLVRRTT